MPSLIDIEYGDYPTGLNRPDAILAKAAAKRGDDARDSARRHAFWALPRKAPRDDEQASDEHPKCMLL